MSTGRVSTNKDYVLHHIYIKLIENHENQNPKQEQKSNSF